jgi:hypothetical protein
MATHSLQVKPLQVSFAAACTATRALTAIFTRTDAVVAIFAVGAIESIAFTALVGTVKAKYCLFHTDRALWNVTATGRRVAIVTVECHTASATLLPTIAAAVSNLRMTVVVTGNDSIYAALLACESDAEKRVTGCSAATRRVDQSFTDKNWATLSSSITP